MMYREEVAVCCKVHQRYHEMQTGTSIALYTLLTSALGGWKTPRLGRFNLEYVYKGSYEMHKHNVCEKKCIVLWC